MEYGILRFTIILLIIGLVTSCENPTTPVSNNQKDLNDMRRFLNSNWITTGTFSHGSTASFTAGSNIVVMGYKTRSRPAPLIVSHTFSLYKENNSIFIKLNASEFNGQVVGENVLRLEKRDEKILWLHNTDPKRTGDNNYIWKMERRN